MSFVMDDFIQWLEFEITEENLIIYKCEVNSFFQCKSRVIYDKIALSRLQENKFFVTNSYGNIVFIDYRKFNPE